MNATLHNQSRFKLKRWNKIKPKTSTIRGKFKFHHDKRSRKCKKAKKSEGQQ